jgi:hypothetical protein
VRDNCRERRCVERERGKARGLFSEPFSSGQGGFCPLGGDQEQGLAWLQTCQDFPQKHGWGKRRFETTDFSCRFRESLAIACTGCHYSETQALLLNIDYAVKMHLMYSLDENGKRVYTLKKVRSRTNLFATG